MCSPTFLGSLSCGNTGSHSFVDLQMMVFERLCCYSLHPQLALLIDRLVESKLQNSKLKVKVVMYSYC